MNDKTHFRDVDSVPTDEGILAAPWVRKALPWLAGVGMGLGHAAVASNCTVPQQGRCSSCGSCVVVVGSLVLWALARNRKDGEFFEEDPR